MSYKTILVVFDIDVHAPPLIKFAVDVVTLFDAKLIGLSAAEVVVPPLVMEGIALDGEFLQSQMKNIEGRLADLRRQFEEIAGTNVGREWRSAVDNPTRVLIETARVADLIVIGSPVGASVGETHRSFDLGTIVLNAGRPMLIAATNREHFSANKILVAWKDTREARRAVSDAIPMLRLAKQVQVVTVDDSGQDATTKSLEDVTSFLCRHGINAIANVISERPHGGTLAEFARETHADMVISGAYGHSRLREWIFGGATRSLLEDDGLSRFMSS